MSLRYGSVCSGIEAATVAWEPLGWEPAFLSEIDAFPCAVLSHRLCATPPKRLPNGKPAWIPGKSYEGQLPNLGDFTQIQQGDYNGAIDLLVGGFPCQSFSIAGRRGGLDDARGQLALTFVRLAYQTNARWLVGENVPALLSSGKGEDFATILTALCGWKVPVPPGGWKKSGVCTNAPGHYGVAWRVLDAEFVRVPGFPRAIPQRRRRLFIVGYRSLFGGNTGDWKHSAQVLLDGESSQGNPPPRRSLREQTAPPPAGSPQVAKLKRVVDFTGGDECRDGSFSPCLTARDCYGGKYLCYENHGQDSRIKELAGVFPCIPSYAGTGGNNLPLVSHDWTIRKLLPLECERLMGFPDNWTRVPWKGKRAEDCPDSRRYKACGNSMCVNVMRWIGMRIDAEERKLS